MTSTISIAISVGDSGPAQGRSYLARFSAETTTATAAVLIAAFTVVHAWLAASIGLGVDESYSLTISRDLALSYFDHPPLHLWIAHFTQVFLGEGRIARLPFVAMSAVSSYFLFKLTRELFGARAGLWALLAFNLTGFFLFAAGCWVLPDGPLNMCMLGASLAALPILRVSAEKNPDLSSWLKMGAWIGLAALSKYHGVIFALGLAGYLSGSHAHHRLLRTPGPYLGTAVAFLLFSPVLIWNAEHGWISFVFQGARAAPHAAPSAGHLLTQIAGEIVLLFPWIALPFAAAVRQSFALAKLDERQAFLLWLGVPLIALCTLAPFWGSRGMPHWPLPGWLMLYPLFGAYLADAEQFRAWPRRWLIASAAAAFLVAILGVTDSRNGWIGRLCLAAGPSPTVETLEWSQLRDDLAQRGLLNRSHLTVFAPDWRTAGKIGQAIGARLPIYVFGPDPRGFAFRRMPPITGGDDGLIITPLAHDRDPTAAAVRQFQSVAWRSKPCLGRNGLCEVALAVLLVRHYRENARAPATLVVRAP